jgi:carnitine-CoA ligase
VTGTITDLVAERAASHPHVTFLRTRAGELTFAETEARVAAFAGGLSNLGIGAGDTVAALLDNSTDAVIAWLATCWLGAVYAPINTAFRGPALMRLIDLTNARVLICDAAHVAAIADVRSGLSTLTTIIVRGEVTAPLRAIETVAFTDTTTASRVAADRSAHPRDLAMLLFTSGTTGRSKGCMLCHRFAIRQAELLVDNLALTTGDVLYSPFPLFHLDAAILTVMPALVLGTTAAIAERFSGSRFWDDIRDLEATVFDFMGATLAILYKRPARADDAANPARLGWGVPLPEFTPDFERRFGLQLVELYGSTDAGLPIYTPLDQPRRLGACGKPIPQYDVRVVDNDGHPCTPGVVGEIVVRPCEPGLISDGYFGMPEATVAATRDLWLHTGDLARQDHDGWFWFVGRQKDAIRRRGENISAFEIEEVVSLHDSVLECAAFGVPSDLTEEDVMLCVVPRRGAAINPETLVAFCETRIARHMIPRYIDIVAELPKTQTQKVEKHRLAERGVTATTWDRDATTAPGPR